MQMQGQRPNVLLFLFDSLSTDDYLALSDNLPSIEALRNSGVWFSSTYCCSPESGPARASLFTGLDMAAHGVWTNGVTLPEHETIISERFTQSGYQTWLFGRRHLAGVANWTTEHTRAGEYNHVEWAHGPLHRSRQNAYLTWLHETSSEVYDELFPSQANPDDTDIPSSQRKAMADAPDELSFNRWVGSRLTERIVHRSAQQPFFAVAGFVVGESMGTEPDSKHLVESLNHRAMQQADTAIGSVMQTLESEHLIENTIVVVASTTGSSSQRDSNEKLIEQAIKMPLIISAPDTTARGVDAAVSTMDLAPTLYQLANVKEPTRIQGRSLLSEKPRQWSLSRLRHPSHQHQTALCSEQFKLVALHSQTNDQRSVSYRLYDLQTDPNQLEDLANSEQHQHQLEAMIDQMIDARVALEDRTEPRIASF